MKKVVMKHAKLRHLALFTAVAGVPLLAGSAFGQLRVDTGHALDASNQVGSGGYNAPTNKGNPQQFQNAIASDNVTAGFGFRGRVVDGVDLGTGLADPFAFRGLLPGQGVDQFIANSVGVPTMSDPTASSHGNNMPREFYGQSNHPSAPPGFEQLPNGPGYIPAQPTFRSPADTRLGYYSYSYSPTLPKPNELLLPGPVDPGADGNAPSAQEVAASPLYGVMPWQISPALQQSVQQLAPPGQSLLAASSPLQQGAESRNLLQTPQQARILQLRQELDQSAGLEVPSPMSPGSSTSTANAGTGANPTYSNGLSPTPLGQTAQSTDLNPTSVSTDNLAPQAGDMGTGQSSRQLLTNMPLPAPGKQSAQFAKLQQAIQQYNTSHPKSDEQANREFQKILRMRAQAAVDAEQGSDVLGGPKAAPEPNLPGIPNPEEPTEKNPAPAPAYPENSGKIAQPGFSSFPDLSHMAPAPGEEQPAVAPPSVPIESFATGVTSSGLANLIISGERLVQDGKYDRAIAAYNDAVAVAPNNPLLLMARASAELGGGYYAQANADLHDAINQDPAVLIGRYDLLQHLGASRLNALLADLKEVSQESPQDSTHPFLYSYVLYNSHHVGKAAEWLSAADERARGQDPAIAQMKKYWNFTEEPTTQP
jgi:tetratricopeptide (TPR) repeat protein